jgi:hypothetical protein
MEEQELFNLIKTYYLKDLDKAPGTYDYYDCYSIEHNCLIELKCREKHYDKLLIEKSKYDRLLSHALDNRLTPFYVCSTPEGVWVFNLFNMEPDWEKRSGLPFQTKFENKVRTVKEVGYLPIEKGHKIYFLN